MAVTLLTDTCDGTITDTWDITHISGGSGGSPLYTGGALKLAVVGSASAAYGLNVHSVLNWPMRNQFEFSFDYKQNDDWFNDNLVDSEATFEIVPADPDHCSLATCYIQMEENGYGDDTKLMFRLRTSSNDLIHVAERISGSVTELFQEAFTFNSGSFDSIKFIVNFDDLWFEVWDMNATPTLIGARTSFSQSLIDTINANFCINVHWHNRSTAQPVFFDNFSFALDIVDNAKHGRFKPPAQERLIEQGGVINAKWAEFFEKLSKSIRIEDFLEIGTGAIDANGNWRVKMDANNFLYQRLEAGTWELKEYL
jgi:hypothetical protein